MKCQPSVIRKALRHKRVFDLQAPAATQRHVSLRKAALRRQQASDRFQTCIESAEPRNLDGESSRWSLERNRAAVVAETKEQMAVCCERGD